MWTDVSEEHITSIFCLDTCYMLLSCSVDFRPWRWRLQVLRKRRFTYGLHSATSQKIATFILHVQFQTLTTKNTVVWTEMQCSSETGRYHMHLTDRKVSQVRKGLNLPSASDGFSLASCSTLSTEAIHSSETQVSPRTTWHFDQNLTRFKQSWHTRRL
jgi:hypothetical protein